MPQITGRDVAILVGFTVVLGAGGWFVATRRSAGGSADGPDLLAGERAPGGSRAGSHPGSSAAGGPAEAEPAVLTAGATRPGPGGAVARGEVPAVYQGILSRKLFDPLVAVQSKESPQAKLPTIPAVQTKGPAQKAASSQSKSGPKPAPAGAQNQPPSQPVTPPKPPLVVTGLMRAGDGYRVVIENTEKWQARIVKVGDEAFGYRIVEVAEDTHQVFVEPAGSFGAQRIALKLGDKTTVQTTNAAPAATPPPPPPASGPPGEGPRGMGGPGSGGRWGSFDPSQLTPEQRQRFEEYRNRRRNGGGGGGGGEGGRGPRLGD
ncbi:MAG: hypothetical protein HYU66_07920 [Armatimonadetes bacterium]|nr:hypothetical protein [Armatimonadota bacterium]